MLNVRSRSLLIRSLGIISLALLVCVIALQAHWTQPRVIIPVSVADNEKEVHAFLATVSAAFNKHDAKAVSELFHPEGELVDADGNVLRTRSGLEAHYAEIFKSAAQTQLSVSNQSLRFIGDSLAMYDGVAVVKTSAREPQRQSRFAAILSKQGNQWFIASIRDLEEMDIGPAAIREKLEALNWLVGEWIEEGGNYRIHTKCQWSEDKMSLIQNIEITGPDIKPLKGTQRISWDPGTQKIKSWAHDTLGGHTEALWTQGNGQWIAKSSGTNRDGDPTSMTMVYRPIDKGRIDVISRDRVVGDEVLPDIAITMVQKPPEAKP